MTFDYYAKRNSARYKRLRLIKRIVIAIIILSVAGYLRSRYVSFSAYRGYSGYTSNTGFLNKVFELFTPGEPGDM